MSRSRFLAGLALASAAALAVPFTLRAQAPQQPCKIVSDTAAVPTREQVAERQRLRLSLDSIGRAHGVAAPAGILFVDVDTTRHGKVFFIDSNLGQPATDLATQKVAEYLSSLEVGRSYQALVRLDADYLAPAPGRRACAPLLANGDTLSELMQRVLEHHPEAHTHDQVVQKRAVLRLVVNRAGGVSYAEVVQPTGDAFIDQYLESIAEHLRFLPATLDGVPYDVRFRFAMQFNLR